VAYQKILSSHIKRQVTHNWSLHPTAFGVG
jgi:hypothetical protein